MVQVPILKELHAGNHQKIKKKIKKKWTVDCALWTGILFSFKLMAANKQYVHTTTATTATTTAANNNNETRYVASKEDPR